MAILVACLVSLRDEFNELSPGRDKSTDGWIGDTSHSGGNSDHNPDESGNTSTEDSDNIDEVHAIDVDKDLKKDGWSMQKCVDIIVGNHKRGDDNRLQYVIYNRKIWSRSWGWTADDYTGSNSHSEHAHFSSRYETAQENDTSPWGLLEDDMPSVDEIWDEQFTDPYDTSSQPRKVKARDWLRYVPSDADVKHVGEKVDHVADQVAELTDIVNDLVRSLAGK